MTRDELAGILERHAKWLRGETGGARAHLSGANLSRANLSGANLSRANLSDANLSRADLSDANLSRANLWGADLSGANLWGADLWGADLSGAHLSGANLSRANLSDANLSGADLSRAHLSGANLSRANLSRANLSRANLSDANLSRADLSGTCLASQRSPFDWAVDSGCDLRVCDGRILVLASRTRDQMCMHGPAYDPGIVYVAPVFSRDGSSPCHPGLYIAGGPTVALEEGHDRILVACWLDEMFIVDKCRVPRFRAVADKSEFERLTRADMELKPAPSEGDRGSA